MSDLLTARVVTMTPEWASQLLERNDVNRPQKSGAIKRYAEDMRQGRWVLNGEPIIVRNDGVLLNGQNRLLACVEAAAPFQTMLVENANGNVLDTIDIGVGRSLGDQLHWRGVSDAKIAAAAVRWASRYDMMVKNNWRQLGNNILPRDEELAYFDNNRHYFDRAMASITPKRRRMPGSIAIPVFTHVLVQRFKDPDTADAFYDAVAYDVGEEDDAAFMLKDWLANHTRKFDRPPPTVYAAIHIKAARLWINGQKLGALLWKRSGDPKYAEPFPRIDGNPIGKTTDALHKKLAKEAEGTEVTE